MRFAEGSAGRQVSQMYVKGLLLWVYMQAGSDLSGVLEMAKLWLILISLVSKLSSTVPENRFD
jgi:hypothetical protein